MHHAYPIMATTDRIMATTDKIMAMVPMRFSPIMATTDMLKEKNPGSSEKKWIMID